MHSLLHNLEFSILIAIFAKKSKNTDMPKILLYITAKVIWNFLFWNTDYYENRAHVHVGKRSTERLCKIWLEPAKVT